MVISYILKICHNIIPFCQEQSQWLDLRWPQLQQHQQAENTSDWSRVSLLLTLTNLKSVMIYQSNMLNPMIFEQIEEFIN